MSAVNIGSLGWWHWLCAMAAWLVFGAAAVGGGEPVPRLVALQYPSDDLVPIVSLVVTEAPYAADPTGRKDCTAAFAAALKAADEHGGTVFAPAGRYRLDGGLEIPRGVTLRGDWKRPTAQDAAVGGTILLAYAGRGKRDGRRDPAFLTVNGGGVRDLTVYYPEQRLEDVVPYPTTIDLNGSAAVKNVTLVNSYRGVLTGSFSTVMNLYGSPLATGITMLHAAAVPRCRSVGLSPRYWAESGLAGAPTAARLREVLRAREACAIQLNRQDAGIFMDLEISGYHTAVKFMPPHGWTYWHDLRVADCEIGLHFTGGSDHRASVTNSRISADRHAVLMAMDKRGWDEGWSRLSKSGRAFGTERDVGTLRMYQCSLSAGGTAVQLDGSFTQEINFQESELAGWGRGADDYAIRSLGRRASVVVYDSKFGQGERHLHLDGRPTAKLVGNDFGGKPDLKHPKRIQPVVDSRRVAAAGTPTVVQPVPDRLPARTGRASLYLVTAAPFRVPRDGTGDAAAGVQAALDQAGKDGGGTVYLPQGCYRFTKHLSVPAGVELRGVNDFMPRGSQCRTLLVIDIVEDCGKPAGKPFISLQSDDQLGGSGVAGVGIWYPHQDFANVQAYPWTIRGMGPGCWVQRVYLGNCYNAVDFAAHDNDKHVLSRVCGSALNVAFMVGNSKTIGWIDNCHVRPQDWAAASGKGFVFEIPGGRASKPSTKDVFRGTANSLIPNLRGAGAITISSGANEQVTAFFTNGATRAFDFVDQAGTGGGNATILIGGSEAGWGAWVKALGEKGATVVNFSFNPMTRLDYVEGQDIPDGQLPKGMAMRIEDTVAEDAPLTMILTDVYGRNDVDLGVEMKGGDVHFKQGQVIHGYSQAFLRRTGGKLSQRNSNMGKVIDGSQ